MRFSVYFEETRSCDTEVVELNIRLVVIELRFYRDVPLNWLCIPLIAQL